MIGIDFGTHSIKFLGLKTASKQGLLLEKIDIEYIENPEQDFSLEKINRSFQKLISRNKIKNKSVNVCISDCNILKRYIENPSGILDDLEKKINEEADNYMHIPEKERMIAFSLVSRDALNEIGKTKAYEVLICGVEKKKIYDLISLLKLNKIKLNSIDALPTAILNLLTFNQIDISGELYMHMDIGFSATKIAFINNGKILYSRFIPIAGKYFTEEISKKLNITFEQAEKYKIEHANITEHSKDEIKINVKKSIAPAIEIWIKQLKAVQDDFNKIFGKKFKLEKIFLSGGSSNLKNIDEYLANIFSCPIKQIEVLSRIGITSETIDKKFAEKSGNIFYSCLGILICKAFRTKVSINLLPREMRINRLLKYRYAYIGIFLSVIVSAIILNLILPMGRRSKSTESNTDISSAKYEHDLNLIKSVTAYQKKFNNKKSINDLYITLLNFLPADVIIENISIKIENNEKSFFLLEISGESSKKNIIEDYIKYIRNLAKNNIDEASINKKADNPGIWQFKVKSAVIN